MTQPPQIEGAAAVVEWFGFWPTFHDAHLTEIHLTGDDGKCRLRVHAWETLSETDEKGFLKTTKHCLVTFTFSEVEELALTSDGGGVGTIIFEMKWKNGADDSTEVQWEVSIGIGGRIRARNCQVQLEPKDQ
jgi:hypothetical protein